VPREINRLDALKVKRIDARGQHADGGGLYLQVSKFDTKAWIFKFTLNGRPRQMGLGPIHTVSLAEARQEAESCRKLVREGIDPIERRKAEKARRGLENAKSMTFKECAQGYLRAHDAAWSNLKHTAQWRNTLTMYVYPVFGDRLVQDIDTNLVMKVLDPIWTEKTETASRVRQRIEATLDWAAARGYRSGENPARWKGHLRNLLPLKTKVRKVKHHKALPYTEIGTFMADLRARDAIAARGLEFMILTATRTGEVIGATWDEIDLDNKIWTIAADRMKAGKEHRVPLSEDAASVLESMKAFRRSKFLFPGNKKDRPLSNMAFLKLLQRMEQDVTGHGFRSTFRDWAAERTNHPREVAEMALAHTISDAVEAAYRRGDLFEKRRRLMEDWARTCAVSEPPDESGRVVGLHE
jgi:integrase